MSALSKYLLEITANETCASFIHPNETCTQQICDMVQKNFVAAGQFYLPTLVIPLVLKLKSLNRDIFMQALVDYGKCILIAHWLATVTIGGICCTTKIFGFYYPWFLKIPIAFGTLFFTYYPDKIKRWQSTGLFNMYIETMIKKSDIRIIKALRKSRIVGTLMFMGFSAAVMTGFKITGVKQFWFTSMPDSRANKKEPDEIQKPCVHEGTCSQYIWKEFFNSTKIALILGSLKFMVSNYRRVKLAQPIAGIKLLLLKLDYNMMAFTFSYNTLFKLLHCCFNNKTGGNTVENTMAAGFLSGITYSLYPIYMLFTYGLTTTLQMGWLMYSQYIVKGANDSKPSGFTKTATGLIDFINKLPISILVMSASLIQLLPCRIQYPYATPVYVHNFISVVTAKRADRFVLKASEVLLGFGRE